MFVLVNLKAYPCDPLSIADAVRQVDSDATIAVAPQAPHLPLVAETGVETYAQHVSPTGYGSHTGSTLAEATTDAGAVGTLLNHSERRLRLAAVDEALDAAKAAGLRTVVCANNPKQVSAVAALGPDAIAIEPPELIGTGTPVCQADPEIVTDSVEAAHAVDPSVDVYCGAGISTGDDLDAAAELGTDGVLLASGVAKADDPTAALEDLLQTVG